MPGSSLSAPRELRFRWYLQVEKHGKRIAEVCSIFGISKKTYHKWYNRDHGYGSNSHRSRKRHPHTKLTPDIRIKIYEAKTSFNYGPEKMRLYVKREFGISVSTTAIYKFFKRRRLIRKPQKKLPWYMPMKERFVSTFPGENVQLDVKYVPGEERTWNYQFRFCDVFTGMQYAFDFLDKSALSTIQAFKQAEKYFPFMIKGIQTDNGGEFRGVFAIYLKNRNIPQRFIPKRSAPWNGKVERANRSVDDEFYLNPTKPWKTIKEYTHWYNHDRPHLGKDMDGMTPFQKFLLFTSSKVLETSPLKVN